MRYVATDRSGTWVALVGFGSPALSCAPRDGHIGWSRELQFRRLRYLAANQRFCVLPAGRRPNTASAVLARTLGRLGGDWTRTWGHPVVAVETFVDPARHAGTCYAASSFVRLGSSLGYGRRAGRYVRHDQVKDLWFRPLHRKALVALCAPFDHWLLSLDQGRNVAVDFNTADFDSLAEVLGAIGDPRARRGVRHEFSTILVFIAAGICAGHRSVTAIAEWAADAPQGVLERLGARLSPSTGRRVAPSESTIGRAMATVDADELDEIVGAWAAAQRDRTRHHGTDPADTHDENVKGDTDDTDAHDDTDENVEGDTHETDVRADGIGAGLEGVAIDGKVLRGARRDDGTAVHLLAAMDHDVGVVIGQRNVEVDKTNEIRAFAPLVEQLDLAGKVVTADALHTQRDAAHLVRAKAGHYIFGVKANQPRLHTAGLTAAENVDLDHPETETTTRGHGRIDRHRVWTADMPDDFGFSDAARFVIVERESSNLDDCLQSTETRIYVTDLTAEQADAANLARLVRGHWSIENRLHWVRDVTFDEDRSQVRTGSVPRVMATLRNLAISAIRLAAGPATNIAAATRTLARRPGIILDLLGVPPAPTVTGL